MISGFSSIAVAGGILSGGKSLRMGHPKDRFVLPDGKAMIEHVMRALLTVVDKLVIAGPSIDLSLIESIRGQAAVTFVPDELKNCGPIAGVRSILASGAAEGYLIAACDQPLINEDLLRSLLRDPRRGCFFKTEVIQPFPGFFPSTWLGLLDKRIENEEYSLRHIIESSTADIQQLDSHAQRLIKSFDSPQDVASEKWL